VGLIFGEQDVSITQAGLRGASRAIDPGAYKTRTGAVPDRGRGLGHTAPTYILVGTTRDLASNGSGGSATFLSLPLPLPAALAGARLAMFGPIWLYPIREPISRHHPGEAGAEVADQVLARRARGRRDGARGGSRGGGWVGFS